jgi:hypothetical protein
MRRPATPRPALLVVAALCGAATGAGVSACGDEGATTTVGEVQTVSATSPATATVTVAGSQTARTGTVEGQVEQTATVVPSVTFAGQGNQSIGGLDVRSTSTLRWSCPQVCGSFAVRSAEGDDPRLEIEGSGDAGDADVKPGSYTSVRVRADGSWTMTLEAAGG